MKNKKAVPPSNRLHFFEECLNLSKVISFEKIEGLGFIDFFVATLKEKDSWFILQYSNEINTRRGIELSLKIEYQLQDFMKKTKGLTFKNLRIGQRSRLKDEVIKYMNWLALNYWDEMKHSIDCVFKNGCQKQETKNGNNL